MHLWQNGNSYIFVSAELFEAASDPHLICFFLYIFLLGDSYRNGIVFVRITVKKTFFDSFVISINVLHLLWCHILPLLEFENIFLPVDDLQAPILWENRSNISSFEPSIFCNGLFCLLLIFVIAEEYTRPSHPNFPSRHRISIFIFILACVFHLWNID